MLTHILLKPKVISLCHRCRARTASQDSQPGQPGQPAHPYTVGGPTLSSHLDSCTLMIMVSTKNGRWVFPFKKCKRLRVKKGA